MREGVAGDVDEDKGLTEVTQLRTGLVRSFFHLFFQEQTMSCISLSASMSPSPFTRFLIFFS